MGIVIDMECKCQYCINKEGKECYLYGCNVCDDSSDCPCSTPVHDCDFGGHYIKIVEDENNE